VEKLDHLRIANANTKWHIGKSFIKKKTKTSKHVTDIWARNYILGQLLEINENLWSHKHLYLNVNCSFIHKNAKLEMTRMSFREWMLPRDTTDKVSTCTVPWMNNQIIMLGKKTEFPKKSTTEIAETESRPALGDIGGPEESGCGCPCKGRQVDSLGDQMVLYLNYSIFHILLWYCAIILKEIFSLRKLDKGHMNLSVSFLRPTCEPRIISKEKKSQLFIDFDTNFGIQWSYLSYIWLHGVREISATFLLSNAWFCSDFHSKCSQFSTATGIITVS
jgi:hypothetical protein